VGTQSHGPSADPIGATPPERHRQPGCRRRRHRVLLQRRCRAPAGSGDFMLPRSTKRGAALATTTLRIPTTEHPRSQTTTTHTL